MLEMTAAIVVVFLWAALRRARAIMKGHDFAENAVSDAGKTKQADGFEKGHV